MKIAIMQPYFFPYIGYFQLMKAVDEFIVYEVKTELISLKAKTSEYKMKLKINIFR